ncbi:hypothetical protein [Streptomyces sp. CB03238]|uniref:hypothetical protein n=1 Tax=Streptomyces sp. CB03238 TaxID=1907777 RepID=UPI00117D78E5|nr:hypothetical protein [Streptomyces sp. CB03238]
MSAQTLVMVASDFLYDSTEEALNELFTAPPAMEPHVDARFNKGSDTIVLDGVKFYAKRVDYHREMDEKFVQWIMDNRQEYPVYGDPSSADGESFELWAQSITDEYFGSPYISGIDTDGYESFMPNGVKGQFFRYEDEYYIGLWHQECGYRAFSRPTVFQVTCYEPAYLLDDDKATVYCTECEDVVFDIESGGQHVKRIDRNGEEIEDAEEVSFDDLVANPVCPNCTAGLRVEASQF